MENYRLYEEERESRRKQREIDAQKRLKMRNMGASLDLRTVSLKDFPNAKKKLVI